MKNRFYFFLILFCYSIYVVAQSAQSNAVSVNEDSVVSSKGVRPYEMTWHDNREATLTFMDCTQWFLQTENCAATLHRSNQEIVIDDFSGKIVYKTFSSKASIFLGLKKPLFLSKSWDCLDVWTFGDHWLWGEPHFTTALQVYACFMGKDGKEHEVSMVQQGYTGLVHKYWFLNHAKMNGEQKLFTHFLGFRLKGEKTDVGTEHTIYFNSIYLYKEELKPIHYKPFPKKRPFPLRKETILPSQQVDYKNSIVVKEDKYVFKYTGGDAVLSYYISKENVLGDILVCHNGVWKQTITKRELCWKNGEKVLLKTRKLRQNQDTLFFDAVGIFQGKEMLFKGWYTILQKSLVFHLEEKQSIGTISRLSTGAVKMDGGVQTQIPFLRYYDDERPTLLCQKDLFTFMIFDWYHTHASSLIGSEKNGTYYTGGGVVYIPKTNGEYNPLYETLFINISPNVHEVFPTVDNPASPMRSLQADRLWAIKVGGDLEYLGGLVSDLRSKGVEKVTIRYHEDFWRAGGESYTFKLTPNPQMGVERIRRYIDFVKSNDWRVGLYSNYTDFAPVNANWAPDWVKRGPKGEWEVSWSRCYAPKPQIAWEQEAVLAPQIQKMFGTNHSYCDVHTAVSPISRVDYDYRVPDAAMMQGVYNRYGMLLMNERKVYNGPVYSEGGHHWWYAGLLDGNYANDDLLNLPIFPDFSLLKIHPLEMDAANTGNGYQYICYALAYGNIGILSDGTDAVVRYAFLQPMQEDYVMIPVKNIVYNEKGHWYDSSEALKRGLLKSSCLKVEYASGLEIYVNFSQQTWNIQVGGNSYVLPTYGFFTYMPSNGKRSSSVLHNGKRLDEVYSENLYYLNTHGQYIKGSMRGNGHYMLKKEKFSWELIPLDKTSMVEFDVSLLDLGFVHLKVVGVDKKGNFVKEIPQLHKGVVSLQAEESVYKYQLIPMYD